MIGDFHVGARPKAGCHAPQRVFASGFLVRVTLWPSFCLRAFNLDQKAIVFGRSRVLLSIHTLANTGGHFEYLLTSFVKKSRLYED